MMAEKIVFSNMERRVDDARLTRIEVKLDGLMEAMQTLARVEERIGSQNEQLARLQARVDSLIDEKIADLASGTKEGRHFKERIFWVIATVALTSLNLLPDGVLGS